MNKPTEQLHEASIKTQPDRTAVIIIDDDPGFSFMLKDYLLSSEQLQSELFSNGNEFLERYRSGDTRRIILDYEFNAGPDGLIILQKIRAINPMAVVIIVSAQDNLETAIETLRKGATDYFLKTSKTVFANIVCSLRKIREMEKNKWN